MYRWTNVEVNQRSTSVLFFIIYRDLWLALTFKFKIQWHNAMYFQEENYQSPEHRRQTFCLNRNCFQLFMPLLEHLIKYHPIHVVCTVHTTTDWGRYINLVKFASLAMLQIVKMMKILWKWHFSDTTYSQNNILCKLLAHTCATEYTCKF